MKLTTIQNRLSFLATMAVIAVFALLVFDSSISQSSSALSSDDGIVEQLEGVLAVSAEHVFDEQYWIANMHSIRNPQF